MTINCPELATFGEIETQNQFVYQNKKLLKATLQYGPIIARSGSMVAYQGDARFEASTGGGMSKFIKKAVTGEGLTTMNISGNGEVFLANAAQDIVIMYLDNDSVSVNGANVLAFSASLSWDIKRVNASGGGIVGAAAGGLYNVVLSGTGFLAITTDGPPVMLDVSSAATCADPNAVVLWSAGVQMNIKTDTGGWKSMVRGGTGEMFQMAFSGNGFVLVQPSEGQLGGTTNETKKGFGL